jgi:hypothetical protein
MMALARLPNVWVEMIASRWTNTSVLTPGERGGAGPMGPTDLFPATASAHTTERWQ